MDKQQLEEGLDFLPRFDAQGLIPCITTDARSGAVLMFAFMNSEALQKTLETGEAHYWSRSRGELWHKGATSGFVQNVIEMRTDCDQDCLWIRVDVKNDGNGQATACHTGRNSCFYRTVKPGAEGNLKLEFKEE